MEVGGLFAVPTWHLLLYSPKPRIYFIHYAFVGADYTDSSIEVGYHFLFEM